MDYLEEKSLRYFTWEHF